MGRFGQWDNGPISFGDDGQIGSSAPSAAPERPFTAPAVQGGGVLPDSDPPESSTVGTGGTVGGAGLDGSPDIQGQNDSIDVGGKSYNRGVLQNMTQGMAAPMSRSKYDNGFDDGGEVPEPMSIDPMQTIMEALSFGRKKMGLPESFYGSDSTMDATASYDDGGVIQPEAPEAPDVTSGGNSQMPDPRHTLLYLTGNGALPPDQAAAIEQHVDPQQQMSEAERTMAAIASAPNPQKAFGLLQHNRIKANAYSGAARAAMSKGDLAQAAMNATKAMGRTPTGYDMRFAPAKGGLAVMGKRVGGQRVQSADDGGVIEPYTDPDTEEDNNPVTLAPQQVQQILGDYDKAVENAKDSGGGFGQWLSKMLGVSQAAAADNPPQEPTPADQVNQRFPRPDEQLGDPQLDMSQRKPQEQGVIPTEPDKPASMPQSKNVGGLPLPGGQVRPPGQLENFQRALRGTPRSQAPQPEAPQPSEATKRRGWEIQDPSYTTERVRYDKNGYPMDLVQGSNGQWNVRGQRTREQGSQTLPTQSPGFKRPAPDEDERTANAIFAGTSGQPQREAFRARMAEHRLQSQGKIDQITTQDKSGIAQRNSEATASRQAATLADRKRHDDAVQAGADLRAKGHDLSRERVQAAKALESRLGQQQREQVRLFGQQLAADPSLASDPSKVWQRVQAISGQVGLDPHSVMDIIKANMAGQQPAQGAQPQAQPPAQGQGGGKTLVYPSGPYAGKRVRQLPNGQVEVLD